MAGPTNPTIKRLFAMSHNLCAFPGCREPLIEGETVVGDVCHVKGDRPGSARYDPDQLDADRHGYENLIVMCRKHHRIIDHEEAKYPVEKLLKMKKEHEESDSRLYDISDKVVQRLGEILTTGSGNGSRTSRTAYPDWTIRELFLHIRPDLLGEPQERWAAVGAEVIDHLSTGRLKVWGRPMNKVGRQGPMKAVDEPGYWARAELTYRFLAEDGREKAHSWVNTETGLPDYADLQVNREEALRIWPLPITEITLLGAARRAYSETRGLPAAKHAEMFDNSPEKILRWYCVWIAQRTQLYGARRPSTKIEAVTIDNPTKDFDLKDNTLTLRELHGNAVWEDLRINVANLQAIICDLKDYGGE